MRVHTSRRVFNTLSLLSVVLLAATAVVSAQTPKPTKMPGTLMVAPSSVQNAADLGKKAHTNLVYINPSVAGPLEAPPYSNYLYETPSSLGCIYHLVSTVLAGCNPNSTTAVISGGSQAIAIVDAYDDPEAPADLAYFSDQFGIPFSVKQFQVVYANGTPYPPELDFSGSWEVEESLDVEWAHAMAPSAKLYLVEADSNYYSDLFTAITVATNLVQCGHTTTCASVTGAGEVSMSWGGVEFNGSDGGVSETFYDPYLNVKNVVFFASSGDAPGPIYPSASPNVVSVGGTGIVRSLGTGGAVNEIAWSDAGSGKSAYEAIPSYQSANPAIAALVGTKRGTPDVAADANPYTGVWVYDTFPEDGYIYGAWWVVGGTSVAAPVWAGIVNNASGTTGFAASSNAELTRLYANVSSTNVVNAANFKDTAYGFCYFYNGYQSKAGYDLCTGIGSPLGKAGK